MLRTILCTSIFAVGTQIQAQELISTAGNTADDGTTQIAFSIGESVTVTHQDGTNQLTQGFHQGEVTVSFIEENLLQLKVYPNPNNGIFQLTKDDLSPVIYKIYSLQGEFIENGTFSALQKEFNLSHFANGNYLLEIATAEDNQQKTILKISKTN